MQMNNPGFNSAQFFLGVMLTTTPAADLLAYDTGDLAQLQASGGCNGCDLTAADLRRKKLVNASLRWSDLRGADLRGSELERADLSGARLENARLEGANLRGAVLQGARMRGVNLSRVRLSGADLRWADLSHLDVDLDLEFVDLVGVLLEGALFKHGVRCAALPAKGGWGCAAAGAQETGADNSQREK